MVCLVEVILRKTESKYLEKQVKQQQCKRNKKCYLHMLPFHTDTDGVCAWLLRAVGNMVGPITIITHCWLDCTVNRERFMRSVTSRKLLSM